jgi:hypothetical protein
VASDFAAQILAIELHSVQAHQMVTKNYPAGWLFDYLKTTSEGQE